MDWDNYITSAPNGNMLTFRGTVSFGEVYNASNEFIADYKLINLSSISTTIYVVLD